MEPESVNCARAETRASIAEYCREIESYLCQKNHGHLIRVVGPAFEVVSKWAGDGVPLKIAFRGIDRYCERYYRKGPRRRPVRIDFCEADVLDVFEEWRRALGLALLPPRAPMGAPAIGPATAAPGDELRDTRKATSTSLPAHLERVVLRLTQARVAGTLSLGPAGGAGSEGNNDLLDRLARELDAARASARGLRGDARRALVARLAVYDQELLQSARAALTDAERHAVEKDAHEELAAFRPTMPPVAYERAHAAAVDRLVRERARLPTVAFE